MSVETAKVFDIFPSLQISSSATAPELSQYESFFRVIGSDTLQAQALIQLCLHYNWTEIGVIYVNDAYGEGLRSAIEEEASVKGIIVRSKSYDDSTMKSAADYIEQNKLYITILIVRDVHITEFFNTLNVAGVTEYPYFYIGVDAWWIEAEIGANEISQYVQGYMGTIPGSLSMISEELYKQLLNTNDMTLYDETMGINTKIAQWVQERYNANKHHTLMNFGYDAMFALWHALNIFNQNFNYTLNSIFENCSYEDLEDLQETLRNTTDILRDILINDVSFNGATGSVSFKENGDRNGGLFLYGYWTENGEMEIFGGKSDDGYSIDSRHDYWPPYFNGQIPKSYHSTNDTDELHLACQNTLAIEINHNILVVMAGLIIVSIICCCPVLYGIRKWSLIKQQENNHPNMQLVRTRSSEQVTLKSDGDNAETYNRVDVVDIRMTQLTPDVEKISEEKYNNGHKPNPTNIITPSPSNDMNMEESKSHSSTIEIVKIKLRQVMEQQQVDQQKRNAILQCIADINITDNNTSSSNNITSSNNTSSNMHTSTSNGYYSHLSSNEQVQKPVYVD